MRGRKTKRAFIETDILGTKKILKFDFNAVADLEEYFDKGVSSIFSKEQVGFRTIRAFYWVGLRWNDRALTIDDVGDLIGEAITDGVTFDELMVPISDGMKASGIIKDVVKKETLEVDGEYIETSDADNTKN